MTEHSGPENRPSGADEERLDLVALAGRITAALSDSGLGAATDVAVTITRDGVVAAPLGEAARSLRHAGEALSNSTPIVSAGARMVNGGPALEYAVRIPETGNALGRIGAAGKQVGYVGQAVGIVQALAEQVARDADREDLSDLRRAGRAVTRAGIQTGFTTAGSQLGRIGAFLLLSATPAGPVVAFTVYLATGLGGGTLGAKLGKRAADSVLK
ncbi:hypothetical protein [Amycolatopsis sp. RTGN1]|uniref:hypothetical protein n=1 Tax=Amycolatopsis ponsaeliensis TaxID=2992142 RepID=UPI0025503E2B|nr:hypothetical protein [Amycolatopsis sp. RTGN1]